jgi:hypothetical protein
MNRYTLATAIIAIVLIAMLWNHPQLKAGLHYLAPMALDGTESPTPTPTPTPEPEPEPTPEGQRQAPAKCLDGSPLTVTSRDSNQTNYRCGDAGYGAKLN